MYLESSSREVDGGLRSGLSTQKGSGEPQHPTAEPVLPVSNELPHTWQAGNNYISHSRIFHREIPGAVTCWTPETLRG